MSLNNLHQLFDQVVDLDEEEQHLALEELTVSNPGLAKRLRALLEADRRCRTGDLAMPGPVDEPAPLTDFGPYRIIKPLGEGGMGNVYLAEQLEPVRRQVALKLIRPDLIKGDMRERFAREQQALATLSYPVIAQFYHAGTTPDGMPYFAMEHVDGRPIDQCCRHYRISITGRLRLFRQVCFGVQQAHAKGVIHRDLKPPNILVTQVGRQPVAKIIDFGIALYGLGDTSEPSGHRVLGTPDYMSPEQMAAMHGPVSIDTRTDVFALGVILYKLLTGRTPFEFGRRNCSLTDIHGELNSSTPPRPSEVIMDEDGVAFLKDVGERGLSPGKARRVYRDELDWIVMKAIHRDPEQRYQTADALSEDLRRFLYSDPVKARTPTTGYRLRKFIGRHKVASTIIGVIALAQVAITMTWKIQARKVEAEAQTVEQALTLMSEAFSAADPAVAQGEKTSARDVLDRAAASLSELEPGHPARLRLSWEIGQIYMNLGDLPKAITLLEEAQQGYAQRHGPGSDQALESLLHLGTALRFDSRFEAAEQVFEELVELARDARGPGDRLTLRAMGSLASLYEKRFETRRAQPLLEQGYRLSRRSLGPKADTTLIFAANLAVSYSNSGDFDRAVELVETLLPDLAAVRGDQHISVLGITMNLAFWLDQMDEDQRAAEILNDLIPRMIDVLGEHHPLTLSALENQVTLSSQQGDYGVAVERQRRLHDLRLSINGERHVETLRAAYQLARYRLFASEEPAVLLPEFERVLKAMREELGDDSGLGHLAALHYAQALDLVGRKDEAIGWVHWTLEHGFDPEEAEHFRWLSDLWDRALQRGSGTE